MDLYQKIIDLGFSGYFCAQILMLLALEYREEENAPLVRSMGALNGGLGFTQSHCGAMIASVAVLGLFASKGSDSEEAHESLNDMVKDFIEWFKSEYGSDSCDTIRKGNMGMCNNLVMGCHIKTFEILSEYGIIE